jgi:hypothetical protein
MSKISQKQLEANKRNAKLGGVKTEEGKAVSKLNATKHALLSNEVLVKGEDRAELIELASRFMAEFKPKTDLERLLIDRIVSNTWRLKRAMRAETDIIERELDNDMSFGGSIGKVFDSNIEKFMRYETCIERGIYKALHELQRIQSALAGEKPPAPIAIDVDINEKG